MKILGIVASPRKGGNTDDLVDCVLEGARKSNAETEKLYLRDLNISHCQGCFSCEAAGTCVIPDDMQKVYPKIHEATGIVIGTPIYMGNGSGLLINFINRCRPFLTYIDKFVRPTMSPSEEQKLSKENACLRLWKGVKRYNEVDTPAEETMFAVIKSLTDKYGKHPIVGKRLEKGKKAVITFCYWQYGEDRYQKAIDIIVTNFRDYWGLDIVDVIPAYRVLTRGSAKARDDYMERAFKAGHLLCQGDSGAHSVG